MHVPMFATSPGSRSRKRRYVVLCLVSLALAILLAALTTPKARLKPKLRDSAVLLPSSSHKLRKWHQIDGKNLDQAAIAMVVGWGVMAAGKRIALELQMRKIMTDEKLQKLYDKALLDQRELREHYKKELDSRDRRYIQLKELSTTKANEYRIRVEKMTEHHKEEILSQKAQMDRKFTELKEDSTTKINEYQIRVEKMNELHKEETLRLKREIEALKEEIIMLKAKIAKLEAMLQKANKQLGDYESKAESYDEREKRNQRLIHDQDEKYNTLNSEKQRLMSVETELETSRRKIKSLQEELVRRETEAMEAAANAVKKARAQAGNKGGVSHFANFPWKELGMGVGIIGAGSAAAAAGITIGQRILPGRLKPDGPLAPISGPPEPPPPSMPSYDNTFMEKPDRIFDVQPCPCTDNPDEWDWHWWLILILAGLLLCDVIYRIYSWLAERNEPRLNAHERGPSIHDVQDRLQSSASDLQLLKDMVSEEDPSGSELKVKAKVLDRLQEVEQTLLEAQNALSNFKRVEATNRESKQVKAQRLELRDALEDCLRVSEAGTSQKGDNKHVDPAPPGGAQNEGKGKSRRVYAHRFMETLLNKTFKSDEIQTLVDKLRMRFEKAGTDGKLNKEATIAWEGNEFDEIFFYRTNLTHVETREGRGRATSTPIIDNADSVPVRDVASAFDEHARNVSAVPNSLKPPGVTKDTQNALSPRVRYSPGKRLQSLFDQYMLTMTGGQV